MAITWILGDNEVLRRNAIRSICERFRKQHPGALQKELRQPRSKKKVMQWASQPDLVPAVYIIEGFSFLKSWETMGYDLNALGKEIILITTDPAWKAKERIHARIRQVGTVIECPVMKHFGINPVQYIDERAKFYGLRITPALAWEVFACAGRDSWRVEMEVLKLRYLDPESYDKAYPFVLYRHPDRDPDFQSFLYSDVVSFSQSCDGVNAWTLIWKLIDFCFRMFDYRETYDKQGNLKGKVARQQQSRLEGQVLLFSEAQLNDLLAELVGIFPIVKDLEIESPIYNAMLNWLCRMNRK